MWNLERIGALWVLGLIRPEDLPELASRSLMTPATTTTLADLAVCRSDEPELIEKLLLQLFSESRASFPSKRDALRWYACDVSRSILAGTKAPYAGAREIWNATVKAGDKDFHELDGFIYAASEMEDRAIDRPHFEREICEEAKRWVNRSRH